MATPRNVFITGRPGVGKTTAIQRALELLDMAVNGFTTSEMREDGRRVGFRIDALDGEGAVMAHVDFNSPVRVSKYRVDVGAVERIAVTALRRAIREGTPAVVDEVGKMELACNAFVDALLEVVEADIPVLGTMHVGRGAVTNRIRERQDTTVVEITRENRDTLPARLAQMMRDAISA